MPRVWLAQPQEAEAVARLMAAFRDHLALDGPTDAEMLDGVERLLGDADTEFLLGAAEGERAPAGVAQLRYRYGVWRAGSTACSRTCSSTPPPAAPASAAP